ncbi:MAG: hypothetical protein M1812_004587 [Candelaria pacifica]|nr:MAG: hypothetical protein M1812_004587 [Candelaria pacifica]
MHLLSEDDAFLSKALRQLFRTDSGTKDQTYNAIVAVVDKLPRIETRVHEQRRNFNNVLDKGREGLAIMTGGLRGSCGIAPDLWEPRSEDLAVDTMSIQQKSTISFNLGLSEKALKRHRHGYNNPREVLLGHFSRSFEVPLANTIFHNGQTSTMYISRWAKESQGILVRTRKAKIQNQLVRCPFNIDLRPNGPGRKSYSMPLAPLTLPRQVAAAVGNIIRRLHLTDHTSETVPASEELEHQIEQLSKSTELGDQRVAVWALVTPRGRWSSEPTLFGATLHTMIEQGSRLHRVLSGGGGWGQKQGLLSLDPDSTYHADGTPDAQFSGNEESFGQGQREPLGEVVNPGDLVQFFHLLTNLNRFSKEDAQTTGEKANKDGYAYESAQSATTAIEFGTIPSTIDNIPGPTLPEAELRKSDDVEVVMNHFGALSEQGVSMSIGTSHKNTSEWRGAQRVGQVVQTKVDVPYSKFNYTSFNLHPRTMKSENSVSKTDSVPQRKNLPQITEVDKGTGSDESSQKAQQSSETFEGVDSGKKYVPDKISAADKHKDHKSPKAYRLSSLGHRYSMAFALARSRNAARNWSVTGQEQVNDSAAIGSDKEQIERSKQERLRRLSERFEQE